MGRRSDIEHEIHELRRRITKYKENIDELNEIYSFVWEKQETIQNEAYEPQKRYDMTMGGEFKGKLEAVAEEYQMVIVAKTNKRLDETSQFLSDIHRIIDRLNELIEECEQQIDHLESELRALESEVCNRR